MSAFLEPDPVLLAFIFFKKFLYLQLLAGLALLRVLLGRGLARWPALVALMLALAGVATVLAPAAGLTDSPQYASAARLMAQGGGITALLVPSVIFGISGLTKGARWRWIDAVHALLVTALLGLWWWVS
ncbi:hypothetical protein [Tropicibacter oceani]|uniref:Uncharacterized protein n=1 Tax=Tropicibacter oceani TaxID=3058420 RepID=A0ABY8QGE5_9RHOB|nr:hypothetical protein [Tropicibacter oceani]WGW03078.1 hypothetical protein QF118_14220 [Tropicibacter oceani]